MFKDSNKYSDSYGWVRWVELEQKPFDKGMQICTSCHTPVKNRDWVFYRPGIFTLESALMESKQVTILRQRMVAFGSTML